MTTVKNIEERIASIEAHIKTEHESIGEAYVAGDKGGIHYHEIHLKAWQDQLAKLEAEREAQHPTLEERCMELLREGYEAFIERADLMRTYEGKYGKDAERTIRAAKSLDEAYERYDHQLEFAAKLLGTDYCDLAGAVRDAKE